MFVTAGDKEKKLIEIEKEHKRKLASREIKSVAEEIHLKSEYIIEDDDESEDD